MLFQAFPQEKILPETDPVTEEAMQSALDVQSPFLNTCMSHSTTAGHLPHSLLELCCAETTTSASHLEAQLQAAPAEQLPENHHTVGQSAHQVTDRGPQQCPH
jgi:hypothetical protein